MNAYAIALRGCPEPVVVSAVTAGKAKYDAYLSVGEYSGGTFADFLHRVLSVRRCAPPRDCYGWARDQYGLTIRVGDRVVVGDRAGEVVMPIGGPWIAVAFDNGSISNVHPNDLEVTEALP